MVVEVDPDATRSELIDALTFLNTAAKAERRRGYAGIHGARYRDLHRNIDVIVWEIVMRDRLGLHETDAVLGAE